MSLRYILHFLGGYSYFSVADWKSVSSLLEGLKANESMENLQLSASSEMNGQSI